MIEADTSQMDPLIALFQRRAEHMIQDAEREARINAENYIKTIKTQPVVRLKHPYVRRMARLPYLTGPQLARDMERVMYHRLHDFLGEW